MQSIGWQKHVLDLVEGHDTIICYGNVKDRYVYTFGGGVTICSLAELLAYLLATQRGDAYVFDCRARLRRLTVQADSVIIRRADGDIPHLQPFDEYFSDANLLQDLSALARTLVAPVEETPNPSPRILIIDYAATLIGRREARTDEEEKRVLLLRKAMDDLAPQRKLILLYLDEQQVPRELYVNAPRVAMFEVPTPSRDEREAACRNRGLSEDLVGVYANLTEGLSLIETIRILDGDRFVTVPLEKAKLADIERAISRFKFGERPDYYAQLSIPKLEKGRDYFVHGAVINSDGEQIGQIPGVRGQDEAVEAVMRMLWRAKANVGQLLREPGSLPPRGLLFFCGPSGTGKTLLAKRIAHFLFDDENAFTRFDMSEYMHDFAVTRLIGAPPGYIGSERGGQLTNAVREKPFSVLLFDEVEKAHPRVLDVFLQVLSDGRLTDSRGQVVFFSETIIIFTSNIGMRSQRSQAASSTVGMQWQACPEQMEYEALLRRNARRGEMRQHFVDAVTTYYEREISRPELLNRFGSNIVAFEAVREREIARQMFDNYLRRIEARFEQVYADRRSTLRIRPEVLEFLTDKYAATIERFGGRAVINALEDELLTEVARAVLGRYDERDARFVCAVVMNQLVVD
jgi:hypothetical protein